MIVMTMHYQDQPARDQGARLGHNLWTQPIAKGRRKLPAAIVGTFNQESMICSPEERGETTVIQGRTFHKGSLIST